jgi:hypothetical protein
MDLKPLPCTKYRTRPLDIAEALSDGEAFVGRSLKGAAEPRGRRTRRMGRIPSVGAGAASGLH